MHPSDFHPAHLRRFAGGCTLALALLAPALPSQAAITLNATRIVYPGDSHSVAVTIANPAAHPYAVQVWVNTGEDDQTTAVPFMATPPLFRLDPGKEQRLQINRLPNDLPTDRESAFYFNAQEIPQAERSDGNFLNIAIRTRIKLFYRPAGLKGSPVEREQELRWALEREGSQHYLSVSNPTPFHYSFSGVELRSTGHTQLLSMLPMVAPFAIQRYALDAAPGADASVKFTTITDFGTYTPATTVALPARQ
jgi:P pilus assembly chaperone PapD